MILMYESLGFCLPRDRIYTQYYTYIRVDERYLRRYLNSVARLGVTVVGYQRQEGFYFSIYTFSTVLILFNHGQDITFIIILYKIFHFLSLFKIFLLQETGLSQKIWG